MEDRALRAKSIGVGQASGPEPSTKSTAQTPVKDRSSPGPGPGLLAWLFDDAEVAAHRGAIEDRLHEVERLIATC